MSCLRQNVMLIKGGNEFEVAEIGEAVDEHNHPQKEEALNVRMGGRRPRLGGMACCQAIYIETATLLSSANHFITHYLGPGIS